MSTLIEEAFAKTQSPPKHSTRRGKVVCVARADEIPDGGKKIVTVENISVGVFNIGGAYFALKNVCPHMGAPLWEGHIQTTDAPGKVGEFSPALEGRVLRCPWHGWEFDIVSGQALYDSKSRVATYEVRVENDEILLVL
jgi:nitrite reductase/ring-hydroxylating ferredoxin subunit